MKPTTAQTRPTLDDVALLNTRLNIMAHLIRERDQLEARIAELNEVLDDALPAEGADTETDQQVESAPLTLQDRLLSVCYNHPDGATLDDFASDLGISKATASSYLYSSRHSANTYLTRIRNSNGTVWMSNEEA